MNKDWEALSMHWEAKGRQLEAQAVKDLARNVELEAVNKALTEQLAEMTRNNVRLHEKFSPLETENETLKAQLANQTARADSYARTAQACLRDAGPALVEARERAESAEAETGRLKADVATLIEAATAAYELFVAAQMDGDKWIENKLGAALKPFAAALLPVTKEGT